MLAHCFRDFRVFLALPGTIKLNELKKELSWKKLRVFSKSYIFKDSYYSKAFEFYTVPYRTLAFFVYRYVPFWALSLAVIRFFYKIVYRTELKN